MHSRSAPSYRVLPLQAQLHVDDSEYEQCSHGIVQNLPVGAVQLGNSSQGEAQGHILDEVAVSAGVEEEGVRLVVGGGFGRVDKTVAHVLLGFEPTIDDAVG